MGRHLASSSSGGADHSGTRLVARTDGGSGWSVQERYEVRCRLGEGGMGIVYEAFDRERGQAVALKRLVNFTPAALYRFKQEFRTLADVHHPNLVRLHELVVGEDHDVFFTMELVRGTDFLAYVQRPGTPREPQAPPQTTQREPSVGRPSATARIPSSPSPAGESPADFGLLRRALRQLVEGVMALHGAGKLHRDIKPSNVLVAHDGRVVILDFGVSTDLRGSDPTRSEQHEMVGTVRYMAPEQAVAEASPTAASDWYSVGVVLYEALVGRTPFVGSPLDVLALKAMHDPAPPAECVSGVPPELDALCRVLLDRNAARRPDGQEILRRLGASLRPLPSPFGSGPESATILVGRDSQLDALRAGFERVLAGQHVTVRVEGASGMGKSAVVAHFLDGLVESGQAAVLRGRAYERESVPYRRSTASSTRSVGTWSTSRTAGRRSIFRPTSRPSPACSPS